jgi:hypothetical protein
MMARSKDREGRKESRLEQTRRRIWGARRLLDGSLLGPLLDHVRVVECEAKEADPEMTCVDPAQGVVWVNPHGQRDLSEAEWAFVLAHQVLHLGLGHAARREGRDPRAWNLACEHATDGMLRALKIGCAPDDFGTDPALAGMREEDLYDLLAGDRLALEAFRTCAGGGRPAQVSPPTRGGAPPHDWEALLAEGIRASVEVAVEEAAQTLGQADAGRRGVWRPGAGS